VSYQENVPLPTIPMEKEAQESTEVEDEKSQDSSVAVIVPQVEGAIPQVQDSQPVQAPPTPKKIPNAPMPSTPSPSKNVATRTPRKSVASSGAPESTVGKELGEKLQEIFQGGKFLIHSIDLTLPKKSKGSKVFHTFHLLPFVSFILMFFYRIWMLGQTGLKALQFLEGCQL
jgi:hypothetical protein